MLLAEYRTWPMAGMRTGGRGFFPNCPLSPDVLHLTPICPIPHHPHLLSFCSSLDTTGWIVFSAQTSFSSHEGPSVPPAKGRACLASQAPQQSLRCIFEVEGALILEDQKRQPP